MEHRLEGKSGDDATRKKRARVLYRADNIIDAPEYHQYARAMGLLTWGTWDSKERPFEERLKDFLQAYPVNAPARFQGTMLARTLNGDYGPAEEGARVARLRAKGNSFGTITEALARYGLKLRSGPQYRPVKMNVSPLVQITRLRNQRLRMIHGRVDIEAADMDEAKVAEIERLEKKHAARVVREARERMRREIEEKR